MRKFLGIVFIVLTAVCLLISPVAAYRITLVGQVNDNQQFIADNKTYEIDNNAVGADLVLNYIAFKVKVVGILRDTRKFKIIKVESFEVVED